MTLSNLIRYVGEVGVNSPRLQSDYRGIINDAIRYCAERYSFVGMHNRTQVTLLSSQTSVTMPDTFKELSEEESPVSFNYGLYNLPVLVTTRSRIEACGLWPLMNGPLSMPLPGGYLPIRVVFMEQDGPGGQWTLNVPPQFIITTNMVFNVQGYYFPAPLVKGDDSNALTNNGQICQAIIALAKAFCFKYEDETSKQGQAAMERFENLFQIALYEDARRKMNGVTLRM